MATFKLENAENIRTKQTVQMQKKIKRYYQELYRDVTKKIKNKGTSNINKTQLMLLQRDIKKRIEEINEDISKGITNSMITTANEVVKDTRKILKQMGFEDVERAFYYIPDNVVRNILTGNVYAGNWTFSKAIWSDSQKVQNTINKIVSTGAQYGKSAYEIAKDIETYVQPTESKASRAIKSWRYARQTDVDAGRAKKVGEVIKDSYYPGRVDYNAQRLARTLISHAYQQSFEMTNKNNPFVVGYRWITSNAHGRICEICQERAETDQYGLGIGVFPKDELPLDHPNGMCTFEAVMSDSMTDIADMIGMWYQSPIGTYPDIDRYAEEFMY